MEEAIKNFAKQFAYEPVIVNEDKLVQKSGYVLAGMGGSALVGDVAKNYDPDLDILIHRSYGLPPLSSEKLGEKLIIASSYSGNTEEAIEAFQEAKSLGLALAAIGVGGKLIELAKENNIPYIQLPNTGIQPRMSQGFFIKALMKLMGKEDVLNELGQLTSILDPLQFEAQGKALAEKLRSKIPVIYASSPNFSLAYNWKIKLNETGKIPAFYNVIPELNHNEMTGYDVVDSTRELNSKFHFILLKDENDHPKIQSRMNVIKKLYEDRGLPVEVVEIKGQNRWEQIFSSLLIADWFAVNTAVLYGLEAEQVPMVEEFKKLIA